MEKAGIIVGATIQLDYASLGYNAVGTINFKIRPENCDNAVNAIAKFPNIHRIMKLNNDSTVNVVATLRNMDEFNRIKDFTKRFPTVSETTTNVWMGIRNIPENIQITETTKSQIEKNAQDPNEINHKAVDADETDKQIIEN